MSQPVVVMLENQRGPGSATRAARWSLVLLITFAAAGEVVRLAQYLSFPSFWEDEVALLINTRDHTAGELPFIKLTAYSPQSPVAAPPFFLWVTQWMGNRFHYSEWSVRLLPLICSLGSVVLFAHLAWRLAPGAAAVWATALLAFSDPLIFQAGDCKPYSGDVMVAILIAWVALAAWPAAKATHRLAAAACVTVVAIWLSYSSVFVLAAVGFCLWEELDTTRLRRLGRLVLCVSPAVASFLAVYFLSIRKERDANLDVYWVHLFPNFLRPLSVPRWLIGGTWELFHYQMYPIGPIMLAAAASGIWALTRARNNRLLILLIAPVVLDLAAACMAQYPYGGTRLTLYLCPFLCLLCGIGAAGAVPWGQAILASVPVSAAALAAHGLFVPQNKGDLRDAMRFLNAHRQSGEPVYLVGNQTIGAAKWYLPNPDSLTHFHLEQTAPIHGDSFWVVICYEPRKYKENKPAMSQPDAVADETRRFDTNGADVIWFAPRPGAAATASPASLPSSGGAQ